MSKEPIKVSFDSDKFVVISKPVVLLRDAITFIKDGEEVGRISAEYDFSGLPSQYHHIGIEMVKKQRVLVPSDHKPKKYPKKKTSRISKWMKRIGHK